MCPKAYSVKRTMIKHFRRRHGFKGTESNIKEYYTRLDPRECNLGLDEPIMTSIFGPPQRKMTDILVGDYVTLANINAEGTQNEKSESEDEQSRDSEKDSDDNENEEKKVTIKVEGKEESEQNDQELEPTDFVSVKIEPMDDELHENV